MENKKEELTLPPYPQGFFEWTEDDIKQLKYGSDEKDINKRMGHKLYSTWLLWAEMRTNEKLMGLVNAGSDDTKSDEFYLKNIAVNVMDRLGKILSNTDITEELLYKE